MNKETQDHKVEWFNKLRLNSWEVEILIVGFVLVMMLQIPNYLDALAEKLSNSVAASDAFFPFSDGIEKLIETGVKAIIQPGGSINDKKVIQAANNAGIVMVFTGTRHFKH